MTQVASQGAARVLYQVDAFTRVPFTGNPAGVVLDAEGMSDEEMQSVARELGNSETAFVFPPDANDHDLVVRFFTPTTEVGACGHATVAAHFARTLEHDLKGANLIQKTGSGLLQRVTAERTNGRISISLEQGEASFGTELTSRQVDQLLRALQRKARDLAESSPVQIVATAASSVVVELKRRADVDELVPDVGELLALNQEIGPHSFFVFSRDTGGEQAVLTWSRMFAPAAGIPEDPVTGNGHGALGAYLVRHSLAQLSGGRLTFTGRQGFAIGRPGDVTVDVTAQDDGRLLVTIGGEATVAFRAIVHVGNHLR
jgi:PhzF family phenazine biosynthesis protein